MLKHTKLSLFTMLAAATAVPALASADHGRTSGRSTLIGEVGTHTHDAEDFVPVQHQAFERIELRAEQNDVSLDGVTFQFVDGHVVHTRLGLTLRPGERVVVDVPGASEPLKMLVLDYGNHGPFYRAHEDARVEISGVPTRYQRAPDVGYDRGYSYGYGSVRDRRTDSRYRRD